MWYFTYQLVQDFFHQQYVKHCFKKNLLLMNFRVWAFELRVVDGDSDGISGQNSSDSKMFRMSKEINSRLYLNTTYVTYVLYKYIRSQIGNKLTGTAIPNIRQERWRKIHTPLSPTKWLLKCSFAILILVRHEQDLDAKRAASWVSQVAENSSVNENWETPYWIYSRIPHEN